MDRGIPTKEVLAEMRAADPPIHYLVGTPRGLLSKYEAKLLGLPWQVVREGVSVKLLAEDKELFVFAQSQDRVSKERAMRRRQLKGLCKRLKQLQQMDLKRDELLKKLGAALHDFPTAARLMETAVAPAAAQLSFTLRKDKLRQARKREGRYLLRSNLVSGRSPEELWHFYIQLTQVEGAFKDLKDDLNLRPIRHQLEGRIEAHIFICFLAYCLHVTLRRRLRDLAPGLTARAVLEKFATIQMLDVHLPTTDQRTVVMRRYTQPESDVQLLLQRLKLELPPQPPPKIMNPKPPGQTAPVVKT
jgi:transposase